MVFKLFAILQKYDFSSKSQPLWRMFSMLVVVCDTAKVRFFKQITTTRRTSVWSLPLFAILQKYDFSSKSQHTIEFNTWVLSCLRYCKSTIFQANHNSPAGDGYGCDVVCDTAKVRFFKQITTALQGFETQGTLFAILQKYDFSSKSQPPRLSPRAILSCLRYCKSTIFQANHNK